jgi:HPt (histidine-containing phosphotransfer) domain-containing protein
MKNYFYFKLNVLNVNKKDMLAPEESSLGPEFEALAKEYKAEMPAKFKAMSDLIISLQNKETEEALTALQFLVHKLAGNAGTFGYMEVSDLCKPLDQEIRQHLKWLRELPLRLEKIKESFHG